MTRAQFQRGEQLRQAETMVSGLLTQLRAPEAGSTCRLGYGPAEVVIVEDDSPELIAFRSELVRWLAPRLVQLQQQLTTEFDHL